MAETEQAGLLLYEMLKIPTCSAALKSILSCAAGWFTLGALYFEIMVDNKLNFGTFVDDNLNIPQLEGKVKLKQPHCLIPRSVTKPELIMVMRIASSQDCLMRTKSKRGIFLAESSSSAVEYFL